ncbi:MAG: lipid kinase YegS [Xanthomonadaceae bacterium]|nr:lipid kinase YegS [Xanthomonadaceae bacterium]
MVMLVLNGKSAGDPAVRDAVAQVRKAGLPLTVRVTWESGDAGRCVREAADAGATTVIAGGGDGTLNEIANVLAGLDGDDLPALGLLPLGSANDFARGAGIPLTPDGALALVQSEPARPIDLLRVSDDQETRWCANLATGGFGTQVTVETHPELKKKLGGLAYVLTGLTRLGQAEPLTARFRGEGFDWQGAFIALGIGNGRQAGGGQVLCPKAVVDDGLIDLTIVPDEPGDDSDLFSLLATALSAGRAAALEQIGVCARMPWLEITAAQPFTLNLDGEPMQASRFRIEAVPARLRMHLPSISPLLSPAGKDGHA